MALTVETGSGSSTADAYDTIANIETYLTSMGGPSAAWSALVEATQEPHVRKATRYLDVQYGRRWKGRRTYDAQALDWPRTGVKDSDGFVVPSNSTDSIPTELKQALAILADTSAAPEDLIPDQTSPGTIKSKRVKAGSVEQDIEYVGGLSQEKLYRVVDQLLEPLLDPVGALSRA
jgi:hypothetical protein